MRLLKNRTKQYKEIIIFLVILTVAIVAYMRYVSKSVTLSDTNNFPERRKKVQKLVTLLLGYLGTAKVFSFWQAAHWFEDEKQAINLLTQNKHLIADIESEYNFRSKSGSLRDDLDKYLNDEQINLLYKNLWGV